LIIACDFDGTIVESAGDYGAEDEEITLLEEARLGLLALKAARHTLILTSCRANISMRKDWRRNPLWRLGIVPFDERYWERERFAWERAYQNMIDFVGEHLPGIFDAIDDGEQGKVFAHLYIDDRAFHMHVGGWRTIKRLYGEEEEVA